MIEKTITMPKNIRYMSQAKSYLDQMLPLKGKYILNKSLTGSGGTEFFINSGRPLVLISPRTGVLLNKHKQHPECHLFRDLKKIKLEELKQNLRNYLEFCLVNSQIPVILVTLDSAKYVIEELKFRRIINEFLFLTDEFQCLISDAAYKGKVDLEFLKILDDSAQNICYMSATPICNTYLDALQQFKGVEYYKLEWDPNVIVEPTIKEIMMTHGESAQSICKDIINRYRKDGCFARKRINNQIVEAKEVVIFVNEVKTIVQIIKDNGLMPNETTILVSTSNKYVEDLKKNGYEIENQCADRQNPQNTAFTFCSKASFEGRDFYSNSAFTYIFIDGTKDWETHDTIIEIPQMLGRQRLDTNPFKYNAIIYYRTKPNDLDKNTYMDKIKNKMEESKELIESFEIGNPKFRKSLINLVRGKDKDNPYDVNYLEVIDDVNGKSSLAINYLVVAAEHSLAYNKAFFYDKPLSLTTALQESLQYPIGKTSELREFEKQFNSAITFEQKMYLYCSFRFNFPECEKILQSNPFIGMEYHDYYGQLGPKRIHELKYDEAAIQQEICTGLITNYCQGAFKLGQAYSAAEVKEILQGIYNRLGLNIIAKASQLSNYIKSEIVQVTASDGSRPRLYRISQIY